MHKRNQYLGQDGQWSEQPEGAVLRLESTLQQQLVGQGRNQLYQLTETGWQAVVDPSVLSASQQGLIFKLWPQRVRGKEFIGFRAVRVIDQMLISGPLQDLTVYDRQGRAVENPQALGSTFLLTADQAPTFVQRLRQLGASLTREDAPLQEVTVLMQRLQQTIAQMQLLLQEDMQCVAKSQQGDLSLQQQFEQRAEQWQQAIDSVRHDQKQLTDELMHLSEGSIEDQAQTQQMQQSAQSLVEDAHGLYSSRQRAEQMLLRQLQVAQTQQMARHSDAAVQLLYRDLADLWRAQGMEVKVADGELLVKLPQGWLHVGKSVSLEQEQQDSVDEWEEDEWL